MERNAEVRVARQSAELGSEVLQNAREQARVLGPAQLSWREAEGH